MFEARTLVRDAIGNTRRMTKNGIIEKLEPLSHTLGERERNAAMLA